MGNTTVNINVVTDEDQEKSVEQLLEEISNALVTVNDNLITVYNIWRSQNNGIQGVGKQDGVEGSESSQQEIEFK